MSIASNGNVGIATTAPSSQLHVAKASGISQLKVGDDVASTSNSLNGLNFMSYNDGKNYIDSKTSGGYLFFRSGNGSENGWARTWMTVNAANGNVGIGTTGPGSKLQVNGGAPVGYAAATTAPVNGLAVSGNVGIGTTAASAASLPFRMCIRGNGVIRGGDLGSGGAL